jgi:hypothetical protein
VIDETFIRLFELLILGKYIAQKGQHDCELITWKDIGIGSSRELPWNLTTGNEETINNTKHKKQSEQLVS